MPPTTKKTPKQNRTINYKTIDATASETSHYTHLSDSELSFVSSQNYPVGTAMEITMLALQATILAEISHCTEQKTVGFTITAAIKGIT